MYINKLEKKLMDIEGKIGEEAICPDNVEDRLEWHLDKIESLIGGGSGGIEDVKVNDSSVVSEGVANINLKTINSESITGEGNLVISGGSDVYVHYINFGGGSPANGYSRGMLTIVDNNSEQYNSVDKLMKALRAIKENATLYVPAIGWVNSSNSSVNVQGLLKGLYAGSNAIPQSTSYNYLSTVYVSYDSGTGITFNEGSMMKIYPSYVSDQVVQL